MKVTWLLAISLLAIYLLPVESTYVRKYPSADGHKKDSSSHHKKSSTSSHRDSSSDEKDKKTHSSSHSKSSKSYSSSHSKSSKSHSSSHSKSSKSHSSSHSKSSKSHSSSSSNGSKSGHNGCNKFRFPKYSKCSLVNWLEINEAGSISSYHWSDPTVWACLYLMAQINRKHHDIPCAEKVQPKKCYNNETSTGHNHMCVVCSNADSDEDCMLKGHVEECEYHHDACVLQDYFLKDKAGKYLLDKSGNKIRKYWRRCGSMCECPKKLTVRMDPDNEIEGPLCFKSGCEIAFGCAQIKCQPSFNGVVPYFSYDYINNQISRCRCDGWCWENYEGNPDPLFSLPCCHDVCEHCSQYTAFEPACPTTAPPPSTMMMMAPGDK